MDVTNYLVKAGERVQLNRWDPNDTSSFDGGKKKGEKEITKLAKKLDALQGLLFAEHKHKMLIVLQGMDTAGKDATIRRVFEGVNPQGVRVAHFGVPTPDESDHDFLWRVHIQVPAKGQLVVFNRSHYEDVLIERVHHMVPRKVWKLRYDEINDFEKMLSENGTAIAKFYLHIDRKEQLKRFQDRLDDPTKHWKFSFSDLREGKLWAQYARAYESMLEKTSTDWAPWYVVPSNHGWFRDLVVASAIVQMLEGLGMRYPKLQVDRKEIVPSSRAPGDKHR